MKKKKIKDLTLEECQKICDKREICDECPLYWLCQLSIFDLNIEEEIEVDIDEKEN